MAGTFYTCFEKRLTYCCGYFYWRFFDVCEFSLLKPCSGHDIFWKTSLKQRGISKKSKILRNSPFISEGRYFPYSLQNAALQNHFHSNCIKIGKTPISTQCKQRG